MCTGYFLGAINASRFRRVRFIQPIFLLIIYNQYTYHFTTTLALLTALAFVCLYLKITPKNELPGLLIFPALSVILYTIAGGAYLLFAVLCVIYELLLRHRWQTGMVYLLSSLLIPYVEGVLLFDVSAVNAFNELLPSSWKDPSSAGRAGIVIVVCILYLLLPLTALVLGILSPLVPRLSSLRWIIESLVLFVAAILAVYFSHDNKRKALFAVDYYACQEQWPRVLAASHHHSKNYLVAHAVNRALYHTGQLSLLV